MLVEMRVDQVAGFDLSLLNMYRWHPATERIDISRRAYSGWTILKCTSDRITGTRERYVPNCLIILRMPYIFLKCESRGMGEEARMRKLLRRQHPGMSMGMQHLV